MGVLIVAGTVALVVAIVQRMNAGEQASAIGQRHLGQPAGTRILSIAGAEGRVAVLVSRPDGERVLLVDPQRGRVVGELRAAE
ncbi:hypothetical protein [Falsiroseomonas bella]|uniref:hypothetical protein n=1 Tax=Falsiroseomonas bella TaxID=2184016 RepID=UPI0018EE6984|nr:hypothetical protein [Falsiroseomonas bella]